MSIAPGRYTLGPDNAELLVHTRRSGAAARAGHDLLIEVASWSGTLEIDEDPSQCSASLSADGGSVRVREGHGGIQALGEDDKDNIKQTIDDEVLKRSGIEFRSTEVEVSPTGDMRVRGELELVGKTAPVEFELTLEQDGHLAGSATVKQTDWGIKPYSALFGTLKVADEVVVTVDAGLPG
jgi:polyisoprenoid-binding protein YceI